MMARWRGCKGAVPPPHPPPACGTSLPPAPLRWHPRGPCRRAPAPGAGTCSGAGRRRVGRHSGAGGGAAGTAISPPPSLPRAPPDGNAFGWVHLPDGRLVHRAARTAGVRHSARHPFNRRRPLLRTPESAAHTPWHTLTCWRTHAATHHALPPPQPPQPPPAASLVKERERVRERSADLMDRSAALISHTDLASNHTSGISVSPYLQYRRQRYQRHIMHEAVGRPLPLGGCLTSTTPSMQPTTPRPARACSTSWRLGSPAPPSAPPAASAAPRCSTAAPGMEVQATSERAEEGRCCALGPLCPAPTAQRQPEAVTGAATSTGDGGALWCRPPEPGADLADGLVLLRVRVVGSQQVGAVHAYRRVRARARVCVCVCVCVCDVQAWRVWPGWRRGAGAGRDAMG